MVLRKYTVLLLAFLLLVSNEGFAFDVHYCCGKIASVSLNTKAELSPQKKCCATIEKKSSCCKDKVVRLDKQWSDAVFKGFFFKSTFLPVIQEFNLIVFLSISDFKNNQIITYCSDANATPLFKLYHQYLFYA